jgi:GNAT superfamily N-acetyltransferase
VNHNRIEVADSINQIDSIGTLVELISKQMAVIGGNSDPVRIKSALENSLKPETRCRYFLWYSPEDELGAFVFSNICSGLESGTDYLWMNELYVAKKYRRNNVASEILSFIEEWSEKQGIRHIACSTGLMNEPARGLFEKKAFELTDTIWVDKSL